MLFCLVYLRWVFIKGVFAVGSEVVAVCDILIFKNIAFYRNYLSCLFVMFCFGRVSDWEILDCLLWLFLWLILRLIDEMVCRVCFEGLFFECFWLSGCGDCFFWLFDLIDCSGWLFFVEWMWFCEKEKDYGRTCIAMLPLLNPVSKWVRSDSNGWSFNLGVYCLLWKRFCVLNVALRMTKKLNRLRNSDGYVLVFKKTQRIVWPCFNCVDFMAQTVATYSSAHKWFWLKKNNHRNAPWKMTDTDWTKSLSF